MVNENRIVYGMLNSDNINLIIERAQTKKDGIYSFRGIFFRVRNGKVTHFARGNEILVSYGIFVTQIGSYKTTAEAEKLLKSIKD